MDNPTPQPIPQQAPPPQTNPVPPTASPSFFKKHWLLVLGGFTAIVLAGISIYMLSVQQQIESLAPTPMPTLAVTSTPIDETANWKTYTNSKYGFSFKYPGDHTAYEGVNQKTPALTPATSTSNIVYMAEKEEMVFCCEPITLSFSTKVTRLTAREWMEEYFKNAPGEWGENLPKIEDVVFAGTSAVQTNSQGGLGSPPYRLIAISMSDSVLVITQNMKSTLLSQIISTFKFTDQTQTPSIPNYKDVITFSYPPTWKINDDISGARIYNPASKFIGGNGGNSVFYRDTVGFDIKPDTETITSYIDKIQAEETDPSSPLAAVFKRESLTINGQPAEAYYIGGEGTAGWYVVLSDGKYILEIGSPIYDPQVNSTENTIIQSFKFIK